MARVYPVPSPSRPVLSLGVLLGAGMSPPRFLAAGVGITAEAPSCPAGCRAPAAKNLGGPWGVENLAGVGLGVPVPQPSSEPAGDAPGGKFGCWRGRFPAKTCSEVGDDFSGGV